MIATRQRVGLYGRASVRELDMEGAAFGDRRRGRVMTNGQKFSAFALATLAINESFCQGDRLFGGDKGHVSA